MIRTRRAARAVLALVLAVALAGCTAPPADVAPAGPRAVTSDEAQVLALTRFHNFEAGTRAFRTSLPVSGVTVTIQGWVDYVGQVGYASVSGSFGTEAMRWDATTVGAIPRPPDADGNPPLPVPALTDPAWQFQELDPAASPLYALLAAVSALASDRPDNPLLVQQTGALWVRDDVIDSTTVTVFAAPPSDDVAIAPVSATESPLRLWIDTEGTLARAQLWLGTAWVDIDFLTGPAPSPLEAATP